MANSAQTRNSSTNWTPMQAYVLATICLVVGIAVGYLIHGSASPTTAAPDTSVQSTPSGTTSGQMAPGQLQAIPEQQTAEAVAAAAKPLLDDLATDPQSPEKTSRVGDFYFDSHVYDKAISYYEASIKLKPDNPSVLTDLGTAYFYNGDSNTAIKKFDQALKLNPTFANALFNLGIVRWQGLKDPKGAVEAWEKLLQTNPNYEQKDHVRELMERAKAHGSMS